MTPLEAALWYAERGLAVFPCAPGTKIPFANSSGSKDATTDSEQITRWWTKTPRANVAIATGTISGIYVVDVDAPSSDIMPRLPMTWQARTRNGGWHYIYSCKQPLPNTGKENANAISKDCDTRGEGGYIVVYPSVVEGKGYAWENDIDPAPLPDWIVERVRPRERSLVPMRSSFSMAATKWAERAVREECDAVMRSQDGGRHNVLIRSAFKLGQIVGAGHLSYNEAEAALVDAITARGSGDRNAMRTIKDGLEAGQARPRSPLERPVAGGGGIDAEALTIGQPPAKAAPSRDSARWELFNAVRSLGGLCDTFPSWVIRGADHPQPGLTLASLLALGSVMAGRRLVFRRNTSSLYTVALASSGEGKNRPQSCLSRVLDECWPGLHGPNSFSSGPAFVDGVRKATNMGTGVLLVLDEYGMQLGNMMGPRASSHRQDIKQSLTELATKGTDRWSPALSLIKGGGKLDLTAPVVSILGSTTPESLHSVLTATDVADGFVGRHVWMTAQDVLPEWQAPDTRPDDDVPADIKFALATLRDRHEQWNMALPVTSTTPTDVIRLYDPLTVVDDDDARAALTACKMECDDARRTGSRPEIPPAVLARLPEMASRIALVLAFLSQPEAEVPVVTSDCARVAIALANESATVFAASLSANRRASWDDPAAQIDLVLAAIRRLGGEVTKSQLLKSCRQLTARTLDDIIERLLEEGSATVEKVPGKSKPTTMLRLLN
jgi:hypothetical protein